MPSTYEAIQENHIHLSFEVVQIELRGLFFRIEHLPTHFGSHYLTSERYYRKKEFTQMSKERIKERSVSLSIPEKKQANKQTENQENLSPCA